MCVCVRTKRKAVAVVRGEVNEWVAVLSIDLAGEVDDISVRRNWESMGGIR